jgi:hypothetical protein
VFESFIERRELVKRAPTVETERPSPARSLLSRTLDWLKRARRERAAAQSPSDLEPSVPVDEAVKTALDQGHRLHLARPEIASAALERCRILEARFLNDMPSRETDAQSEAWAELAAAYDSAANHADAALCWLNALWNQAKPNSLWSWGWLRAEARSARSEVKAIDPIPWLAATPGPGSTRALAAWVVWASAQKPSSPVLLQRSADLHNRLEASEHWLPIRSAWLARTTLAQVAGADVLALARTRDRLF